MGRRSALLWSLAGALILSSSVSGEIFRWTDAEGRVHFTQDLSRVPPEQRDRARPANLAPERLQTYAAPEPAAAAHSRPSRRRGRVLRIPFEKRGNMMLVQVRLNDLVTAPFLVDTGASDVAIPAAFAEQAGLVIGPETPRAIYQTANGPVSSPLVVVDSIEAGDARVERVRAHVTDAVPVGLLGGAFFNNFTFQIDPAASVITAVRNERVRAGLSELQWRQRFHDARRKLEALQHYIEENHFTREGRVADLERNRLELEQRIEALEEEADAAGVPQAWRDG